MSPPRPLAGSKVLETGALIAGPFCAKVLAEFGSAVVPRAARSRFRTRSPPAPAGLPSTG